MRPGRIFQEQNDPDAATSFGLQVVSCHLNCKRRTGKVRLQSRLILLQLAMSRARKCMRSKNTMICTESMR